MQPGALFISNADSPYRGLPQDDSSFKKVPWLCVTASRRFCRQVFNCYKGKYTSGLCRSSPFIYIIHAARLLVKSFFKFFFCKLCVSASYSRIFYCLRIRKAYKLRNATNRNDCDDKRKHAERAENSNHLSFPRHFSLPYRLQDD